MSVENKRSQFCAMSFLPLPDAEVRNVPGSDKLQVHGTWVSINVSSGEWKESREYGLKVFVPIGKKARGAVSVS